jgi:pimeloyl-ACP methyl ester carboxylesterase
MRFAAESGGPILAQSLAGLAAARTATATDPSRTTVVAHSYGTVVVDEAADEPGLLAADAVVLLGSPGMEDYAASLEAPAVFDAASATDPVTWFPWDGDRWTGGTYGATGLPISPDMGHSDYLEPEFPTLAAVGEVVAGTRTPE